MDRPSLTFAGLAALALAACVEVERDSGLNPSVRTEVLARGLVRAADGGTVEVVTPGAFEGVGIEIPPGALDADLEIEIVGRFGDPRLPSIVQTIEFRPAGVRLLIPARARLRYSSVYAATAGRVWDEVEIAAYAFEAGPTVDERVAPVLGRDPDRDLVEVRADRLGTYYGAHAALRTLISQPTRLVDPAVPLRADLQGARLELSHEGAAPVQIGQGSLDSFWQSPADQNLLIVPGLLTDPLLATSASGPAPQTPLGGLKRDFANVVVFQYPSGRALRDSANALYDALLAGARPGFGCNIFAHGSGGLVARYAIERANLDETRPGHRPGQPKLDEFVDAVVLLATPHQGASVAQSRFDFLLSAVFEADLRFVQGAVDLIAGPGGFVDQLNTDWVRPRAEYYAIAGDVDGSRFDGLVDVLSAVGVPRTFSRPDGHQVFSGPIYEHAAMMLLADPIGVLGQARAWLGKARGNSAPIAGGVGTPIGAAAGAVEIPLSLTDRESDTCFVVALLSVDGGDWRIATPADGGVPSVYPAEPAPGAAHVFRWDSTADRVGLLRPQRAVLRFMVNDGGQLGTPGQTGSFVVDNRPR